MVFIQGNRQEQLNLFYKKILKPKEVESFTYLGVTLSLNGNFYKAQKALSNQAMKSLFYWNTLFDTFSLDI